MKFSLQLLILAVFTVLLACQLPRRALFFSPAAARPPRVAAAFVTLGDQAYRDALNLARASAWSRRSAKWAEGMGDDGLATLAAPESVPVPPSTPVPDVFRRSAAALGDYRPSIAPASLRPGSFAAEPPTAFPPPVAEPAAAKGADVDFDSYQTFNRKD